MRYRAFKTKKDGLYYFQFLSEEGNTLLKSQAYQDKNACFNGIKSVLENAGEEGQYERNEEGGNHYFILKAGNGQEIGRSEGYGSDDDLSKAIAEFISDAPNATSNTAEAQDSTPANVAAGKQSDSAELEKKPYEEGPNHQDNYKPLAFYESNISGVHDGFDKFEAEGEYYFTYNLDKLIVLISEGYQSENSRDNGINSVTNNLPLPERYQHKIHPNGKYFFNLRAGNNQEIATSRWFDNEGQMNNVIGLLTGDGPKADGRFAKAIGLADEGAVYIDYKPLEFYQERITGEEFGYDSFADDDKHYFTVNHLGKPVLISETYQSEAGRDNGIQSVKKNVKNEKRYDRKVHPNGMHYFNLIAGNKQEIATSRWFDDPKEMEKAIHWLQVTGGTRSRKKAQKSKTPTTRTYVQKGAKYLCSDITYDTFQSSGNERFYFVFHTKDDRAVLINGSVRGFGSKEEIERGIEAVQKFAPHKKNYELKTTKNDKFYFYVKNDKGKNIARSSLFYNDEDSLKSDIGLLACGAVVAAGAAPPMVAAGPGANKIIDDYLPCEDYKGESGFHKFYREDRKEHFFSYIGDNGKVLLRSEGYTTEAARDNGIESVAKNAPISERWKKDSALNGKYHYYMLRAGNNQEIARSCYYESEAEMLAAMAWVQGEESPIGVGSSFVGGALMSAAMLRNSKAADEAALTAKRKTEQEQAAILAAAAAKKQAEEAEAARLAAAAAAADERRKAEKEKAAALAAAAATTSAATVAATPARTEYVEERRSGLGWLWWLIPLLLLLALLLYFLKGCDGCNGKVAPTPIDSTAVITGLGPDGAALGFAAGTVPYEIANFLSDKQRSFPKAFGLSDISFPNNSAALDDNARAQLDDIVKILKAYPDVNFDINGYIGSDESNDYEGSKDFTLDKMRAKNIYDYLISQGIDEGRMKFYGKGINDSFDAEIVFRDEPFGPDGAALGFGEGTVPYEIANFLSSAGSMFPKAFGLSGIEFAKNSADLNAAAKRQLDDLAIILKQYPSAKFDIYGYIGDNERSAYRGSKELTMDDVRARNIYNYLKSKGVNESNMNFSGNGVNNNVDAEIIFRSR